MLCDTLGEVLTTYLVKHLHLGDIQALRQTSRGLRSCVDAAHIDTWLNTARNTLPSDHLLFATRSKSSIHLLAEQTAKLHQRLHAAPPQLQFTELTTSAGNLDPQFNRLQLTANHDGSRFVSEADRTLCCLVLDPTPTIRTMNVHPSPFEQQQPEADYETRAVWAPDDSAVLLRQWTGCDDAAPATWQVAYLWDMVSLAMKPIRLPQGPNPGGSESMFARSKHAVLLSEHDGRIHCDVYGYNCQAVAHFEVAADEGDWPSPVVTRENRLAFSCVGEIQSWCLVSGRLERSVRTPHALAQSGYAPSMLMDRTGCRLALLPADLHAVYVFDAPTLAVLGCVPPPHHAVPTPHSSFLIWGVEDVLPLTGLYTVATGYHHDMQICRLVPGRTMVSEERWWGKDLAMSPDGTYTCDFVDTSDGEGSFYTAAFDKVTSYGAIRMCDAASDEEVFCCLPGWHRSCMEVQKHWACEVEQLRHEAGGDVDCLGLCSL